MTDERRKHQCHRDGCDSQAAWATRFSLDVAGPGTRYPVRMACSIIVCDRHKSEADVRAYILSDANREKMIAALTDAGYPEPDFLSAKVTFEPLDVARPVIVAKQPASCDRAGCKKEARWQIKQRFRMLWQKGKGDHQIEVLTKICVCDEHKAATRAADFKDKESESSTRAWLAARGVSMPDFETMAVGFVPLERGQRIDPRAFVGDDGPLDQFDVNPVMRA